MSELKKFSVKNYKDLIVLGPTASGKSYIIEKLGAVLGRNNVSYCVQDVLPILNEMFEDSPGVVDYLVRDNENVRVNYFEDWMLEKGYSEMSRRIDQILKESPTKVVICEVATDNVYKKAVETICNVFEENKRSPVLLYLKVLKTLCLERNKSRDYMVMNLEDFFKHSLEDIEELTAKNGVELKIIDETEEPIENQIESISQSLWNIS